MPHGGRTTQQLLDQGVSDTRAYRHALQEAGGSPAGDIGFQEGVIDPPQGSGVGDVLTIDDLFDFYRNLEDEAGVAVRGPSGGLPSGPISITRTGDITETSDRIISETVRRYLNVQTPEAFLNDWEVAFNAHLGNLRANGGLSSSDMERARGLMGTFFSDYIGELGRRASEGEDIFRVVGLGEAPVVEGTRPGEQTEQKVTTEGTTEEKTKQTAAQAGEAESTTTTAKTTTSEESSLKVDQTEEIVSRPELDTVFAFSPSDFLKERFGDDPGALTTVIRGRAPRRRPQGIVGGPVSARRT